MDATEYLQLRREIQGRCDDDLAAINRVWALSHPNESLPGTSGSTTDSVVTYRADAGSKSKVSKRTYAASKAVTAAMEKAFAVVSGTFSWRDVQRLANGQGAGIKKSTLSQFLRRKADSAEIEVVKAGEGRRATTYKKTAVVTRPLLTKEDLDDI